MTDPSVFGARLRQCRRERKLTQADLTSTGLSKSYVSLLESGHRQPTRRVAELLADRLDVDVAYLFGAQDDPLRQERQLEARFAELAMRNGDPARARVAFTELLRTGAADPAEAWELEHGLALALERCGEVEQAVELLESLSARAETQPARFPLLQVTIDLSRCYREAGDLARAVQVAESALARAEELGLHEHQDLPRLMVTLAGASRERGDHTHASQLLRRLLDGMLDAPNRDRGAALWNAALVAAERGQHGDGIFLAERALALFAEEDDVRADGMLRTTLAWMLLESRDGDVGTALRLLRSAHERLLSAGMTIETAYTETELARAHAELGDAPGAIEWARSSLARLGDRDRLESARARVALARALLVATERAAAVEELTAAAEGLELLSATRQAAVVWRDLGEVYAQLDDLDRSRGAFVKALDLLGLPSGRVIPAARRLAPHERPTGHGPSSGTVTVSR